MIIMNVKIVVESVMHFFCNIIYLFCFLMPCYGKHTVNITIQKI